MHLTEMYKLRVIPGLVASAYHHKDGIFAILRAVGECNCCSPHDKTGRRPHVDEQLKGVAVAVSRISAYRQITGLGGHGVANSPIKPHKANPS